MKTGRKKKGRNAAAAAKNNIIMTPPTPRHPVCLFCATSWRASDDPLEVGGGGVDTNCDDEEGLLLLPVDKTEGPAAGAHQSCHRRIFTELGKDGSFLQGHLRAIFILRQVLRMSEEQVAGYLVQNNGSLNPAGWFSLCSSCDKAVRECFTLQRSIAKLGRKLEVAKGRLLSFIHSTGAEQRRIKRRSRSSCPDLTFDIRETILKDYSVTQESGIPRKVVKKKMSREGMSNNESTGSLLGDTDTRRPRKRRRATKLSRVKANSKSSSAKPGRKCPRRCGTSQSDSKTAATPITIRVSRIPPEEHHDHDQSMELEPPESILHNPIIPESYDSEIRAEHNFDDDDDDNVASLCEDHSASSENNDDDAGSNWSPSGAEPDSEAEEDDQRVNYMTSASTAEEPATREEKEDMSSSSSQVPFPSPQSSNRLGSDRSRLKYVYRCDLCPASYESQPRLSAHSKLHEENGEGGVVNCTQCGWLVSKQRLKAHTLHYCRSNNNNKGPRRTASGKRGRRSEEDNNSGSDWSPSDDDGGEPDSDSNPDEDDCEDKTIITTLEENKQSCLRRLRPPAATFIKSLLKKPIRARRPSRYHHRCEHCPATYTKESRLSAHSKLHKTKGKGVTCAKCGWLVPKQRLKQHASQFCSSKARIGIPPRLKRDPDDDGIPYYCDHCHMIFPQESRLLKHCSNHHSEQDPLPCQYCASKLVSTQLLTLHVEALHSAEERHHQQEDDDAMTSLSPPPPPAPLSSSSDEDCKPLTCPYCPKTFDAKMKLDFHIARRHRDCLLTCKTCKLKSVSYSGYVTHLEYHKRRELVRAKKEAKMGIPFYCDHCHMIFTQEIFLVKHVRAFHKTAQPASCPHCDSKFPSKQLLRMHVDRVHHEQEDADDEKLTSEDSEPKLSCSHCPEVGFPSKMKLDFHIAKVHREALLTCPTCGCRAASYHIFLLHARSHQRRTVRYGKPNYQRKQPQADEDTTKPAGNRICYSYQCPHCPAKYSAKGLLSTHLQLHENNSSSEELEQGVNCDKCGWLISKQSLDLHQSRYCTSKRRWRRRRRPQQNDPGKSYTKFSYKDRTTTQGIPYYCDHCHMIFTASGHLVRHFQASHGGSQMASCQYCASTFVSRQLLQMHTEANHAEEAGPPEPPAPPPEDPDEPQRHCPHCSETFPSKMKLDYHIASVHRETLFTCPICQYKFDCYSKLEVHSRTHQGPDKKEFSCHLCGVQLGSTSSVTYHMQSQHAEELGLEVITCPICGVNMPNRSVLRSHTKFVHEKKKEHFCEFCGKAFGRTREFRNHLLLHTAPRELQYKKGPFPCQHCDSKFNVRQGLYYHMKREHSDKYRFRCEQCGKGYCSKATLTPHVRECNKGGGGSTSATTETPTPK